VWMCFRVVTFPHCGFPSLDCVGPVSHNTAAVPSKILFTTQSMFWVRGGLENASADSFPRPGKACELDLMVCKVTCPT